MNELEKIKEVEHFYSKMKEEGYNKNNFQFNLSAFLSAAESVHYYIKKEIKSNNVAKEWYGNQLSDKKIISFLVGKDGRRNINVHEEPISPGRDVIIHSSAGDIHTGDGAILTIKDKNGNIVSQKKAEMNLLKSAVDEGLAEPVYKFDDWSSDEDVFSLCKKYLEELKIIVEDGRNRKFLS